jgi:hypothetical protein
LSFNYQAQKLSPEFLSPPELFGSAIEWQFNQNQLKQMEGQLPSLHQ